MIRPELFMFLIVFSFTILGLVLVIYGLISFRIPGFNIKKRIRLLSVGAVILILTGISLLIKPGGQFVGKYVLSNNHSLTVELKSDRTFQADSLLFGKKVGNWELINSDEFYFIEVRGGRLIIDDTGSEIKLRLVSNTPPYSTGIELLKL